MHDGSQANGFLDRHPEVRFLEAFVVDVNGVARGKWIARERAAEILTKGMPLPRSVYALDIWGKDVDAAGLSSDAGDPDGHCLPVPGTLALVPWLSQPTAQILMGMGKADGTGFYGDPRNVLGGVLAKFAAIDMTPVVATELEFYFIDPDRRSADPVRPPEARGDRWHADQTQVLAISELHRFEKVFGEIARICELQGIPADTTLRENGPSQYEINLRHVPDALLAADQTILLRRIVRGVARQHGLDATFMAKPYGNRAGSGMHVHFSLVDGKGNNLFRGTGNAPSEVLLHAAGGLLETMAELMAIFAPHANSYRRLQPGTHAPTRVSWGYDNRAASVRAITSSGPATRLEHRVAGADANPYLVLAAILGGAYAGIREKLLPGAPLEGDNHSAAHEQLPGNWDNALGRFVKSTFVGAYLGKPYKKLFAACKQQELAEFRRRVSDVEYDAYCSAF